MMVLILSILVTSIIVSLSELSSAPTGATITLITGSFPRASPNGHQEEPRRD